MSNFNRGDRVRYVGNTAKELTGQVGTVKSMVGASNVWTKVQFDRGDTITVARSNLAAEPVKTVPQQYEVDAALDILRRAGNVDFTPNRPVFKTQRLSLNSKYVATVDVTGVTVGCQTIALATAVLVGKAAQEALDYIAVEEGRA